MYLQAAQPGDLGDVVDLLNREIRDGVAHFGTQPEEPAALSELWRAQHERYPWVVCRDDDGAFLGFARAGPWKSRGGYALTVETSVYVEAAARGRGVGAWLYAELFEQLWFGGYRTVIAGITLPNPSSVRLHERYGMKHIGTFQRVGYKAGAWRDVGYWVRYLGEDPPPGGWPEAPRLGVVETAPR